jgi:hypothetical protein
MKEEEKIEDFFLLLHKYHVKWEMEVKNENRSSTFKNLRFLKVDDRFSFLTSISHFT